MPPCRDLDRLRTHSESATADLLAAGWTARFDTVPGVGHEPPDDNVRRQVGAIRFALGMPTAVREGGADGR
jgi:hypothetical protein